ncbi:hypothetical protein AWC38_SpisGene5342, partial [Stylophora pistillata]
VHFMGSGRQRNMNRQNILHFKGKQRQVQGSPYGGYCTTRNGSYWRGGQPFIHAGCWRSSNGLSTRRLSPGCPSPGCLSPGCPSPGCLSPGCLSPGCLSPGCLPPGCLPPGYLCWTGHVCRSNGKDSRQGSLGCVNCLL